MARSRQVGCVLPLLLVLMIVVMMILIMMMTTMMIIRIMMKSTHLFSCYHISHTPFGCPCKVFESFYCTMAFL